MTNYEVKVAYENLRDGSSDKLANLMAARITYEDRHEKQTRGKLQVLKKLIPNKAFSQPPQIRTMVASELKYGASYGFVVTILMPGMTIVHDLYFDAKHQLAVIKSTM